MRDRFDAAAATIRGINLRRLLKQKEDQQACHVEAYLDTVFDFSQPVGTLPESRPLRCVGSPPAAPVLAAAYSFWAEESIPPRSFSTPSTPPDLITDFPRLPQSPQPARNPRRAGREEGTLRNRRQGVIP